MNTKENSYKVEALVSSLIEAIERHELHAGEKILSIRAAAEHWSVSRNTVVDAYGRLEARGYIQAKLGSGYYVREARKKPSEATQSNFTAAVDVLSLLREQVNARNALRVGDGRPPAHWMESADVWAQVRKADLRDLLDAERGYGDPAGFEPLRRLLARVLEERAITAQAQQILMTHGANHALDLMVRHLLNAGDKALVDAPGYYPLFAKLKLSGIQMLGVPRLPDGPDIEELERLMITHKPKVYFIQSLAHNPTGSSISLFKAHKLLQLAAKHNVWVVEDDAFAELLDPQIPRLATLDQFERVFYVSTFSKTLSAGLRVGYIAGPHMQMDELRDLKMLTIIASSDFSERILFELLSTGHYKKHITKLRQRAEQASIHSARVLQQLGLKVHPHIEHSFYHWVELPSSCSELALARSAAQHDIFLATGAVFYPNRVSPSPTLRVNVAYAGDERFKKFLSSHLPDSKH